MLKNISRLECTVNDKVGHLYLENDTPLHVVKEILFQFQKYIGSIEDNIKQQQEKAQAEEESKTLELDQSALELAVEEQV